MCNRQEVERLVTCLRDDLNELIIVLLNEAAPYNYVGYEHVDSLCENLDKLERELHA